MTQIWTDEDRVRAALKRLNPRLYKSDSAWPALDAIMEHTASTERALVTERRASDVEAELLTLCYQQAQRDLGAAARVLRDWLTEKENERRYTLSPTTPAEDAARALFPPNHVSKPFVLTLKWTCHQCGWTTVMEAPGFAGDGHDHFPDGRTPCGPLSATRQRNEEIPSEPAGVRREDYFSDRCGKHVEVLINTFVPCGEKLGHSGPCKPITLGAQTVA